MVNAVILTANELGCSEIFVPAFKTGTHVSICAASYTGPVLNLIVNNRHPDIRTRYENYSNIAAVNLHVAEKLGIEFTGDLVYIESIEEEKK